MEVMRAINEDFRQLLEESGWPDVDAMKAWVRLQGIGGTKHGPHSALRNGRPASILFWRAFVRYLTRDTNPRRPELHHEWFVLKAYLERVKKVADAASLSDDAVIELISTSVIVKDPDSGLRDLFDFPVEFIANLYASKKVLRRDPWKAVRLCSRDPGARQVEIDEAIEWVFVVLGRDVAGSPKMPPPRAIGHAEHLLEVSLSEFQRRAREWCEFEPWTVVRCFDGKRVTGVSITLPLRKEIYEEIRQGKRATFDCGRGEMTQTSPYILAQAMAQRSGDVNVGRARFSRSALPALVCQQAWCSTLPGIGSEVPLHILAPGGTRMNTTLLKLARYRPTGTSVHRMPDVKFMERQLWVHSPYAKITGDVSMLGSWVRLQRELRELDRQGYFDT